MKLVKMTNIRTELISSLLNLVDFEAVLSVDEAQTKGNLLHHGNFDQLG